MIGGGELKVRLRAERLRDQVAIVETLKAASAALISWRERNCLSASDLSAGAGDVLDERGRVVAHVSYDGCVWSYDLKKLLWDNQKLEVDRGA